ncbi:MAG TPA: PQQ-binding-like beta-propeller repeat protein, partial [Acidimicrobiales bacterium]|nr:PQQ-binding-like beta-propeller repeat protein [Acidimicrobiales bacterium]
MQTGFSASRQGFNSLETTVTAANVANLGTRWTATVDGPALEAVIFAGKAFVPGARDLTALRLRNGARLWSGCCGGHGPAVIGGQLRVASADVDACHMQAIDPATGASTPLATFGPPLPGFAGGCSPSDVLAVGDQALAPWDVFVGPVPAGPPGPCNRGESLFVTGPGVSSVDVDTAEVWDRIEVVSTCTSTGELPAVPASTPISSDGQLAFEPHVLTLDALPLDCTVHDCPPAWTADISGAVDPGAHIVGPAVALGSGDLALATSDGHVVVVDGTSHLVEWSSDVLGAPLDQPLAATGTTVYATATDGTVAAFPVGGCGAATCPARWTATLASAASVRPSIGGDVLYVGSADGTVTALPAGGCGAATCSGLWTGTTPAAVTGAPAIFSGTVVVGSSDGTVT